jgi:hypothetical protein
MKGKLLLILGIIAIAGIAYANSDFIDVSKIMSVGSSGDLSVTCFAFATDPPALTSSAQTGTIHGQSCAVHSDPATGGIGHLGLLKNKHCSDPSVTITITVKFKTNAAVSGASLGTITLPITTTAAVTPSIAGSATVTFTTGSGSIGVASESDTISPASGTSFTITDSGITVTTSGPSEGTITITEIVSASNSFAVNTPLATPSISGSSLCPTVTATLH